MKRMSAAFLACLMFASMIVASARAISDEDEKILVASVAHANVSRIEVYPAYYENNKMDYRTVVAKPEIQTDRKTYILYARKYKI